MQLFSTGFLNIIGTALAVPLILAAIATLYVRLLRLEGVSLGLTFWAVLSFGVLGFVTGKIMGNSREAAVGTVVPAVLTLLGGITAYLVGVKGPKVQGPVSAMVFCFALSLFVGSAFGSQLRYDYEVFVNDPQSHAQQALLIEKLQLAVELKRLSNFVQIQRLKKGFESKYDVDLSKFETGLTKPVQSPERENAGPK